MIEVTLEHGQLAIRFPFDRKVLAYVKTLSGRSFKDDDPTDKHWTVPQSVLPALLDGPLAERLSLDYDTLAAYDEAQGPLREQWHRLLSTLKGEPSPLLLEIAERYGYHFKEIAPYGI